MLKWLLIGLVVLVALVVGVLLAVPLLLDTPAIRAYIAQATGHALGRPVKWSALSISALPLPSVRLRGFEVAEDPNFGSGPFVTVGEGRLRIRLWPLLQGRVELADLTLEEPRIHLVQNAAGHLNVATLGGAAPEAPPLPPPRVGNGRAGAPAASGVLLSRVRVVDGAVDFRRPGGAAGSSARPLTLEHINLTVTRPGAGEALRLSGSALGPGGLQLTIREGTVALGAGRSMADAHVKATVEVESKDVGPTAAALLPSPAVSGPLKGRLQVAGSLAHLTATGSATFTRLAVTQEQPRCAPPKRRSLLLEEVHVPLVYAPPQLESPKVEARVAKGTVGFHLVVSPGPPLLVSLHDIQVKGMQLEPVLVDYLCQRNAVTGPLELTGEASLRPPETLPTLQGSGRLHVGAGRVVGPDLLDAVRKALALTDLVSAAVNPQAGGRPSADSPLNFDSITATYTIRNGVVHTEDLVYESREVRVTGAGTYGLPDGRIAMDVTVTQGSNRVKARLAGTPGALTIVPTDVRLKAPKDLRKTLDRLLR